MKRLSIADMVTRLSDVPLIDVRTPAEFADGRIPGAHNIPLFSNEERAKVGTTYKKVGRQNAILQGLEIVGPKMRGLVERAWEFAGDPDSNQERDLDLMVHCWRGGMRSGSVGWLYENYGWRVGTIEGGYKAYRNWALDTFDRHWKLVTIGGRTGTGKTEVLHALAELGEQVIDLEGHADHRGSAFGALGLPEQPSQQTFENELAYAMSQLDPTQRIFIEDESRMVGTCCVPQRLMEQKRVAPMIVLDKSVDERLDHLVEVYGDADVVGLADAFRGIEKRLGGQRLDAALDALEQRDLRTAAFHALDYYDRAYDHGISKREPTLVETVLVDGMSHDEIAQKLAAMDI
jgi:tRNA 2-selenouridine synthase